MNVYVVPSVHDVSSSRGLCGKLSDTTTDDFVMRDGTQVSRSPEFSESWRYVIINLKCTIIIVCFMHVIIGKECFIYRQDWDAYIHKNTIKHI